MLWFIWGRFHKAFVEIFFFSSFNVVAALIYGSGDVSGGLCCADLVVTVMTCLGGRWRQTAQQTPTTLIIREQDCFGQKCSAHSGVNNTVRAQTVQTNAVCQSACLWIFQEFGAPSHNIRPHRQCVITLNIPLRDFTQLHREAAVTMLELAEFHYADSLHPCHPESEHFQLTVSGIKPDLRWPL